MPADSIPNESRVVLMLALAGVHGRAREFWVDNRLAGMTLADIAEREGITPARAGALVRDAERKIKGYIIEQKGDAL